MKLNWYFLSSLTHCLFECLLVAISKKIRWNVHVLCVLWMFHKSLHDCFHRQTWLIYACCHCYHLFRYTLRRQSGLYSTQSGLHVTFNKKRFLNFSNGYVFLAFKKLFLGRKPAEVFLPQRHTEQHKGDTRFFSNHFYYFPHYWYSILYASLKDIFWRLTYAK